MRRLGALGLALALVVALFALAPAQSDPGVGAQVPTLAEHNALEARVAELEDRATAGDHEDSAQNSRLDTIEEWVAAAPQSTPTEEPTPEPTEEPTPTPEPEPEPTGVFPTRSSVGPDVDPTEVYAGDCNITANDVVIEAKIINCPDTGLVVARGNHGLVIRNSIVNGGVYTGFSIGDPEVDNDQHPRVFTIESSRVYSGHTTNNARAVAYSHFKVTDSLLVGSHSGGWGHNQSVITGSYIQTDGTSTHQSGFRMNRNSVMRGNTLSCTPSSAGFDGGCSAHAVFYREYGIPTNLAIEGNYFKRGVTGAGEPGGPWFAVRFINCESTDDCTDVRFTGNQFDQGQGTDGGEFPNDAGDVWVDNVWADGEPARSGQSR